MDRSYCFSRRLFVLSQAQKRVLDPQSVDHLPVLQILGIQNRATGFDCRSQNQTVVDGEPIALRNANCRFVSFKSKRTRVATGDECVPEASANFKPVHLQLSSSGGGKFIHYLNAYHSA